MAVLAAMAAFALLAAVSGTAWAQDDGSDQTDDQQNATQQSGDQQNADQEDSDQQEGDEQNGDQPEGDEQNGDESQISESDLRVKLNLLLQEHVYLTLGATEEIIEGDFNTEGVTEFRGAMITLDKQNTIPLSDLIGQVYGEDARDAFFALWQEHIAYFFDYAHGVAGDDYPEDQDVSPERKMEIAREGLDHYAEEIGTLLAGANPNLSQEMVTKNFDAHVKTMLAAIDAQGAHDGNEYEEVQEAAALVPGAADALASAIAKQFPDMFSDSSGDSGN